jgi:predicted O-methyltransferase YrrM
MPHHALDDPFLFNRLVEVIAERKIEMVIETGTAHGESSVKFCKIAPHYIGIDICQNFLEETRQNIQQSGIDERKWELYHGASPEVLEDIVPTLDVSKTLFFFDAHDFRGNRHCPLWEEIRAIPKGQGIFVFHDFLVPGKDFGVDHYMVHGAMREFNYELVKDLLMEWSPTHRLEYATQSDPNSSYRGWAIVYPS